MAAKGYNGLAMGHSAEKDRPIHKDMMKYLYDKGKGTASKKEEVGSVLYNRGMLSAMLTVEAIRKAQEKYGKRVVTGEEVRWGAENLNIDNARIKALGVEGIIQPIKTSCHDHGRRPQGERPHVGRQQVELHLGPVRVDAKLLRPMIEASAQKYAARRRSRRWPAASRRSAMSVTPIVRCWT
jgi:branched-chain amino acid transport system substrate-binding protein